jgi:hypothetical protein
MRWTYCSYLKLFFRSRSETAQTSSGFLDAELEEMKNEMNLRWLMEIAFQIAVSYFESLSGFLDIERI